MNYLHGWLYKIMARNNNYCNTQITCLHVENVILINLMCHSFLIAVVGNKQIS